MKPGFTAVCTSNKYKYSKADSGMALFMAIHNIAPKDKFDNNSLTSEGPNLFVVIYDLTNVRWAEGTWCQHLV